MGAFSPLGLGQPQMRVAMRSSWSPDFAFFRLNSRYAADAEHGKIARLVPLNLARERGRPAHQLVAVSSSSAAPCGGTTLRQPP